MPTGPTQPSTFSKAKELPPIKTLLAESWQVFKDSIVRLLVLQVLAIFFFLVVGVVVGVVFIGIGMTLGLKELFSSGFSLFELNLASQFGPIIALGFLALLVFILLVVAFGSVIRIATILVIAGHKEKQALGDVFKKSFGFIIPLALTSLMMAFIIWGGLFFFILPAIIFGIFFMYVNYEVVLSGKKYTDALKGSMQILLQNFWDIVGRVLLFIVLYFLVYSVSYLPFAIITAAANNSDFVFLGIISPFARMIINFFLSLYSLTFTYTLYKQAKEATDESKKVSFTWVWVVAIVGWLLAVSVGIAVFFALSF